MLCSGGIHAHCYHPVGVTHNHPRRGAHAAWSTGSQSGCAKTVPTTTMHPMAMVKGTADTSLIARCVLQCADFEGFPFEANYVVSPRLDAPMDQQPTTLHSLLCGSPARCPVLFGCSLETAPPGTAAAQGRSGPGGWRGGRRKPRVEEGREVNQVCTHSNTHTHTHARARAHMHRCASGTTSHDRLSLTAIITCPTARWPVRWREQTRTPALVPGCKRWAPSRPAGST